LYRIGLKEGGHCSSQAVSWKERKMLAKVGPRGLPIGIPSVCVYRVLLKRNGESETVARRSLWN